MPTAIPRRAKKTKPASRTGRGRPYTQLDRDTFEAFKPFINVNDPGVWACRRNERTGHLERGPIHTIPKRWRAALDAGDRQVWGRIKGNTYRLKHVYDQRSGGVKHYYTSGVADHGLLMPDTDAHHDFQRPDVPRAAVLLERLFGRVHLDWSSDRGRNAYIKVRHCGQVDRFNAAAARLQAGLIRLADRERLLVDFEVKGTATVTRWQGGRRVIESGSLAKLPFRSPDPWACNTFGLRAWNLAALAEFTSLPVLELEDVEFLCDVLDAIRPDADDLAHAELRQLLKDSGDAEKLLQAHGIDTRTADEIGADKIQVPIVTAPASPIGHGTPTPPALSVQNAPRARRAARLDADLLAQLAAEPDRFKAAARFCWAYARKIRRVPLVDECLDAMHELGVYTGSWGDGESGRRARVAWVLEHGVGPTFDAAKCGSGADLDPLRHLAVRYVEWARKTFGTASVGIDEKGKLRSVDANDVAMLTAISEFCLSVDRGPQADGGMPWERVAALWDVLHAAGIADHAACQVRWRRTREFLDRHGIVIIIDRKKRSGKSFRYALGEWFPGNWRKRQEECRTRPSLRSGTSTGGVAASLRSADATPLVQGVRVGTGALLTHTRHTHILNLCVEASPSQAVRIAPRAPP